ncbi:hypothetical protein EIP86_005293 [Pleurotus ostreatoroseus]|nr:hypothetical protein EIP86_005293 [Pleurotus ostreatoroseus]
MSAEAELVTSIASHPFRPHDDPTADFVLQTSDNVRFWLCKAVVSRASPVFNDLFDVPQPSRTSAADGPDEYIDNKPIVRMTEDAAILDVFMRCCYPIARPEIDPTMLGNLYAIGEKYEAEAVCAYARQEIARCSLHPKHCLRAYLVAYRFGLTKEVHAAAKQIIQAHKREIVLQELPEHHLVPATAITRLEGYRSRCLRAVGMLCTPQGCLRLTWNDRPPMWFWGSPELDYQPLDPRCTCRLNSDIYNGGHVKGHPSDDDHDVCEGGTQYKMKLWFTRYLWDIRSLIEKGDVPIRQALLDSEALGHAVENASSECDICGKDVAQALVELLKDIEAEIDKCVAKVPFEESDPQQKQPNVAMI